MLKTHMPMLYLQPFLIKKVMLLTSKITSKISFLVEFSKDSGVIILEFCCETSYILYLTLALILRLQYIEVLCNLMT